MGNMPPTHFQSCSAASGLAMPHMSDIFDPIHHISSGAGILHLYILALHACSGCEGDETCDVVLWYHSTSRRRRASTKIAVDTQDAK